jgi:hypothetical protein
MAVPLLRGPGGELMPIGTCDPATRGQTNNMAEVDFTFDDQVLVKLIILFGWDGVSVKPNCDGPLTSIQGINLSATATYYGWFLSKSGTARSITMPPGFNQTIINPQLRNQGFRNYSDTDGIDVTDSPISPF